MYNKVCLKEFFRAVFLKRSDCDILEGAGGEGGGRGDRDGEDM